MLIGEVARRSGLSARMLRHYDRIGLVSPSGRTSGGYREYVDADLRRLLHVESLRSLGLTLEQAARALDDPSFEAAALIEELAVRTRERIATESELLRRLEDVRGARAEEWTDVLSITSLIRGLASRDASHRQRTVLASDARPSADVLTRALLDEPDANVAGALRWALGRADDALDALAPGTRDPDPAVRRRVVEALAELDTAEAAALLVDVLDDDDARVRSMAALALGRRGDDRAVPALLTMIVTGDHDVDAAEQLGVIAQTRGRADELVAAIGIELRRDDATPAERSRLVQALAELPSAAARRLAGELKADDDRAVTMAATYVERTLGGDA